MRSSASTLHGNEKHYDQSLEGTWYEHAGCLVTAASFPVHRNCDGRNINPTLPVKPSCLSSAYRSIKRMNLSHWYWLFIMYLASIRSGLPFTNLACTSVVESSPSSSKRNMPAQQADSSQSGCNVVACVMRWALRRLTGGN